MSEVLEIPLPDPDAILPPIPPDAVQEIGDIAAGRFLVRRAGGRARIPPRTLTPGTYDSSVRHRGRQSYTERIKAIEEIADGLARQVITRTNSKAEWEQSVVTPNAKERLAAIQELAKLGHVHADAANESSVSPELALRKLVSALSDPSVRSMLLADYPDVMRAMLTQAVAMTSPVLVIDPVTSNAVLPPLSDGVIGTYDGETEGVDSGVDLHQPQQEPYLSVP